uniref:Uncharacterized protein n=1 Tax=Cynoglossus semilaevis TaxID=244447 RepID=A0A3P8WQH3_CYNSE
MAHRFANDLICPVCFEIFKDPVLLSCSHSFCKKCLDSWWADKVVCTCPVCNQNPSGVPASNLVLKNLCEAFSGELSVSEDTSAGSEALCNLHSEKLRLYCLDHQQPVCVVCRESKAHFNHSFKPIDECADDYRDSLRTSLKPLQQNLDLLNQVNTDWNLILKHIDIQAQDTENMITKEFHKLQHFLQQEQEKRIAAVKEEAEQKRFMMKERIEALSKEIESLSDVVRATEEQLRATDISLLKKYPATTKRVQNQCLQQEPKLSFGVLVDKAKHLGNLAYKVWNKMKNMVTYTPVILDPNTAEPHLVIGADLRTVLYRTTETALVKNPERFDRFITVLGSDGFTSGKHSWEVEVRHDVNWAVGVVKATSRRKGETLTDFWEIWFEDNKYRAFAPSHTDRVLTLRQHIQIIRVTLDWDRGKLIFSDPLTNTTIYTFSHRFTEALLPFINTDTVLTNSLI